MNNPVYYDVCLYLQSQGFGVVGQDLFGGEWGESENSDIDAQTAVFEGVQTPFDIKELIENLSVQILIRGEKRQSQLSLHNQKARPLYEFLTANTQNIQMAGGCYTDFEPESFGYIGRDEQERPVYSMNFQTYRNALGA